MSIISSALGWIGGNKIAVYLGAALALAVLLGWLFWSRAALKTELAEAGQTIGALQTADAAKAEALASLRSAYAAQAVAMAERDSKLKKINAERAALARRLGEVMRDDEAARYWGSALVPDAVRGLCR